MSNTIRFTGLSSGLDTQSIVDAMLLTYKNKVDTAKQNKTLLEWKKDAYKEMNTKINTFYDKYIDNISLANLLSKTKTNISNTNIISIPNGQNVPSGNYEIQVEQMASGSVVNTQSISLEQAIVNGTGVQGKEFKITFGEGESAEHITVDVSNKMTAKEFREAVQNKINEANIPATFSFDATKGTFSTTMNGEDKRSITIDDDSQSILKSVNLKDAKLLNVSGTTTNGKFTMKVGSKEISVDVTDNTTIGEFETAVNAALKDEGITSVNFKFDEKLKAFNVNTKTTGTENQIDMDETSLKLINAASISKANDALVIYNGITITSSTNRISTSDFDFDIIGESKGEKVTLSSVADTDAIVNYVKEFVEAYNTLLEDVNTKVGADKNRSYKPLTDEQKEEMSEKEIELWENKIKDSLFSGDSFLRDFSSTLQSTLQGTIDNEGSYKILYDIGISTGNWKEQGKLHLDEDKLTKALSDNPDDVANILKGLTTSLKDNLKSTLKSRNDLKSYNSIFNDKLILQEITQKADEITQAQNRYDRMETYYYAKFTAMENMMSQYNSQSTWLSQL